MAGRDTAACCKNISTDLLIAASMICLMCPVICTTKNLGLLCKVRSRHVQGLAKICLGSKSEGGDKAVPGPFAIDLTVRINKK